MSWEPPQQDDEQPTPDPYASRDDAPSSFGGTLPDAKTPRTTASPPSHSRETMSTLTMKCGATALVNGVNGGVIGGIVGLAMGAMEAQQLDPRDRARFVGFRTGSTASQFGSFLGGYTGLRCAAAGIRQKDDPWNAGFAAGTVSVLGALRSTSDPRALASTAVVSGLAMMLIESISHSN